jgi:hypothetical protein
MAYMRPFMVILELNDGTEGDTRDEREAGLLALRACSSHLRCEKGLSLQGGLSCK